MNWDNASDVNTISFINYPAVVGESPTAVLAAYLGERESLFGRETE